MKKCNNVVKQLQSKLLFSDVKKSFTGDKQGNFKIYTVILKAVNLGSEKCWHAEFIETNFFLKEKIANSQ